MNVISRGLAVAAMLAAVVVSPTITAASERRDARTIDAIAVPATGPIVIDGKLFFGYRGFAGEIGHCPVIDEGGRVCACGRRGCLTRGCLTRGCLTCWRRARR